MKNTFVVLLSLFATSVFAGECDINLESTESMAFKTKEIIVNKNCAEVTLNFKNNGTLPKAVMGHNAVISKKSDMNAVVNDGIAAGLKNNYVKTGDKRVVVATTVIGGGESTSIKFKPDTIKPNEDYVFFCSFPGHSAVMKGIVKLV